MNYDVIPGGVRPLKWRWGVVCSRHSVYLSWIRYDGDGLAGN
jgi:hypothetical protein